MNAVDDPFEASRACLEGLLGWLAGSEAAGVDHTVLEEQLTVAGRELVCQLLQDHLDLRAATEDRLDTVVDTVGVEHRRVEPNHRRRLATVVGEVTVTRLAYRHRGHENLHPADGVLNLPVTRHSHGLSRLAAIEASRGSFADAVAAIERGTGTSVGKRQVEGLARHAAVDFDDFYQHRPVPAAEPDDVVVLSADGKGIVMRPEALRPATAAASGSGKLATRLSKGEKRNRKRMAEVGAVYDLTPVPRTPDDILTSTDTPNHEPAPAPTAKGKWLTASVTADAASVITDIFDEAERRDPHHRRTWVALVDGNNHQISRLHAEATTRGIDVAVVVDFVHVLEYLWTAAWSFHTEGDPVAEAWVKAKAAAVLAGKARTVAAAIRRKATTRGLNPTQRRGADRAAAYLTNKADYLDYPTALTNGWPIATGIIEGACRHLVADRLDITGARWSLDGAEAILKLRALRANGDFDHYWNYHIRRERHRNHESRYTNDIIPTAA